MIRKDSGVFPNKELTLCEKFANGLQDQYIRREAKRLLKFKPSDFYEFRDEIIQYSEEETADRNTISNSETVTRDHEQPTATPSTDFSELKRVIEAQQKQIDSLTSLFKNTTMEHRSSQPPVCYYCNQVGHIKRRCPLLLKTGQSENK